jgi:hypothetical protein
LESLGKLIETELPKLKDVGQLAKWGWLKKQHSIAVAEYKTLGKPRFWHMFAEAEKAKKPNQSAIQHLKIPFKILVPQLSMTAFGKVISDPSAARRLMALPQ